MESETPRKPIRSAGKRRRSGPIRRSMTQAANAKSAGRPATGRSTPPRTENGKAQPARPSSTHRQSRLEAAPAWLAVARGIALFVGAFALLTVFGELRTGGFDANFGWVDLRPCPPAVARGLLGLSGTVLVLFGLFPNMPDAIRSIGILGTAAILAVAIANAIQFGRMRREGVVVSENDLSHSVHLIVALLVCIFGLAARPRLSIRPLQNLLLMVFAFVLCAATLPLTMIACAQNTKVNAEVNYKCQMVAVVGPFAQPVDEQIKAALGAINDADDQIAVSGIAAERANDLRRLLDPLAGNAIVDSESRTLDASVAFAAKRAKETNVSRIAVVTDFHQLPRARKLFREHGFDVVPVPIGDFQSMQMVEHRVLVETVAYYRSYVDRVMQ